MKPDHLILVPEDDVTIALADLPAGALVAGAVPIFAALPSRQSRAAFRGTAALTVGRGCEIILAC